ncbi:hypothetical protein B0T10DRAFT_464470 [Thelonectria olida]|uniref:Uncharacterized protein n=1 Tax=Thelonectria olida TaxID=1576542 RepID=A0A9P9AJN3_9HYPO|nr:hypothetical protein B0T10DRAFT_464470 [Thelonectria olida]
MTAKKYSQTQNFISGVILFLTVGIYLAILGLGAGGAQPSSAHVTTTAHATLYAVFIFAGCFGSTSGRCHSRYLSRIHPVCICRRERERILHCLAALPPVRGLRSRGCRRVSHHQGHQNTVRCATSVYATFIVIMVSSVVVSLVCILPSDKIVREDGTHLAHFTTTDFRTEIKGCLALLKDGRILLLIVPMAATEMSSALIPTLTAHPFNLRTRSLSALINWTIQIPAMVLFGLVLDNKRYTCRVRGAMDLTISCVIVLIGWGLTLAFQIKHIKREIGSPAWDWTSTTYVKYFFVIFFTGVAYAIDQMTVLWVMSALSNEPKLLARYGGFFKGMLSAGLAIAFGQEAGGVSYLGQTLTQTTMQAVSFPVMFYLVLEHVSDTNYFAEEGVIPPQEVQDFAAKGDFGFVPGDAPIEDVNDKAVGGDGRAAFD